MSLLGIRFCVLCFAFCLMDQVRGGNTTVVSLLVS
jgi:hypothetical protein